MTREEAQDALRAMHRGEPDYPDQVPRKQAYEAAHPDVEITFHGDHWRAVVTAPDGSTEVNRYTLKALLDKLVSPGPPADGPSWAAVARDLLEHRNDPPGDAA